MTSGTDTPAPPPAPPSRAGALLRGALMVGIAVSGYMGTQWPHLSPVARAAWEVSAVCLTTARAFIDSSWSDSRAKT